jgi:4-carboxymuconolactone decarboxylase
MPVHTDVRSQADGTGIKQRSASGDCLTPRVAALHMLRRCPTGTLGPMRIRPEYLTDVPEPSPVASGPGAHARTSIRGEVVSYSEDRRTRGLRALAEITGDNGASVVESMRDIAPDLADWIVDFSYGDVLARPGLDRRTRQLATIAALTALGNAQPQLKVHIKGALFVGCKPQEIVEVILQMAVFAGFPAAINALEVAREAFQSK